MARGRWVCSLNYKPKGRNLVSVPGITQRGNRTMGNPFLTLGMEWCSRCKAEMDCDTEASHRGGVYVFKRWCKRCGLVVKSGAYKAPLVSDQNLMPMAFEWINKPEKDRR